MGGRRKFQARAVDSGAGAADHCERNKPDETAAVSRERAMMTQNSDLAALRDRLARLERGEVWGGDHLGPYTADEKAAEIARIKSRIASLQDIEPK